MVTNPDARGTCWLDANGWRRPRGAGELPPSPPSPFPLLVSLPRSLTPSRESEEDIIGVHNRAGQKGKQRVDPFSIFM